MPRRFTCTGCGAGIVTFLRVGEVARCRGCGAACEVPESAEPCEGTSARLPERGPAPGDPDADSPPVAPGPPTRANLVTAGLFAATLLLIPVSLALQFRSFEYTPGGLLPRPAANIRTWAFLYAALLAAGALAIRPRAGAEAKHRRLFAVVTVQAAAWLLAWVLEIVLSLSPDPFRRMRILLGSFSLLFAGFAFFAAPVVTGFLLRRSRGGGLLLLGQILPWPWFVHSCFTWGFVT